MMALMSKSMPFLQRMLSDLRREARAKGLSDAQWAARAGVRAETLTRLKDRSSCDLATLTQLAAVVGARLDLSWARGATNVTASHWPESISRDDEERLLRFLASRTLERQLWLQYGSPYFMAGVATMLASLPGFGRLRYLDLAEALHPGMTTPEVFEAWLHRSPIEPSRFVPMLHRPAHRECDAGLAEQSAARADVHRRRRGFASVRWRARVQGHRRGLLASHRAAA
jgi:hypothetical protein